MCLDVSSERGDLRVREPKRRARLLGGLRGERLDPAEYDALAVGRGRRQRIGGCFGGAGQRLDIDDLRAEFSSAVPGSKLLFWAWFDTVSWVL